MIRNRLAHGAATIGTLEDYKVLFFILILLYHDLVNPRNCQEITKYLKWIDRARIDLRLGGEEPTIERIEKLAAESGLDVNKVRKNYSRAPNNMHLTSLRSWVSARQKPARVLVCEGVLPVLLGG